MIEDVELLRRYAKDGCAKSFEVIVRRHIGWVYSAERAQGGIRDLTPADRPEPTRAPALTAIDALWWFGEWFDLRNAPDDGGGRKKDAPPEEMLMDRAPARCTRARVLMNMWWIVSIMSAQEVSGLSRGHLWSVTKSADSEYLVFETGTGADRRFLLIRQQPFTESVSISASSVIDIGLRSANKQYSVLNLADWLNQIESETRAIGNGEFRGGSRHEGDCFMISGGSRSGG